MSIETIISVLIMLAGLGIFGYFSIRSLCAHRRAQQVSREMEAEDTRLRIIDARAVAYKIDDPEERKEMLTLIDRVERTLEG